MMETRAIPSAPPGIRISRDRLFREDRTSISTHRLSSSRLAGTYGNVGRNVLEGPSLKQFDLALAKRWSLSERVSLQFRSDFFNLFNHTNLNTPNPVVYAAATGGRRRRQV